LWAEAAPTRAIHPVHKSDEQTQILLSSFFSILESSKRIDFVLTSVIPPIK